MSTNPALIPSGGSLATPQSLAATNDSDGHKRQHILIGQSGTLNVVALANSAPAGTEYGLITRNIPSGAQPVTDNGGSLTVDAPVGTPVYNRLSDGSAALIGQKAMAGSLPVTLASDQSALPSGTNYVGRVRQTDGTNDLTHLNSTPVGTEYALPVRQVGSQPIARQNFFSLNTVAAGVAVVATEAMLTLTPQRNGTAATAGTSFAITSGRSLRIQSIILSLVGAATASHVKVFLRYNPTGAVTTASTMIAHLAVGQPGAANNLGNTSSVITFADGLDIPAGAGPAQIGLSQIGSTANTTIWVTLIGYEV